MRRAVLLHHRLPNEDETHFDWLLESVLGRDPEERVLIAFRVQRREDVFRADSFAAQRIDNHRRLYLTFEGALSHDRGVVARVASGRLLNIDLGETRLGATIDWGDSIRAYFGRRVNESDEWRFTAAPDR